MPANTTGQWGSLQAYPYVPAHAVVLSDGKLLTFGTDQSWVPGSPGHWYHSIFDPATGQNTLIDHSGTTTSDIFCAAAMIIPGTDKVMMSGGGVPNNTWQGQGTSDINIFDPATGHIMPAGDGEMVFPRWYPTLISLPTGQMVVLGGTQYTTTHIGMPIPEIYTPGEGWRQLTGAAENDFIGAAGDAAFYPKTFLNSAGDIIYFSNGKGADGVQEVNFFDPSGNGKLTQIGTVPFSTGWGQPAIMYAEGKILIMASNGDLWTMDINDATPTFVKTGANVASQIHWSNMSVLADGSVLITGGGNQVDNPAGADRVPTLWNPNTNQITKLAPEVEDRLYHSAGILLTDGTVMSMGGTADPNKNYQIFKPPYLFDANGNEAMRPVITSAPQEIVPGQTFSVTVDNAAAITKLTFTKTGAVTHSSNMDNGFFELQFAKGTYNTLTVTVPDGVGDLSAGNWMLFAWNDKGVPSKAPILSVEPTFTYFEADGSGGVPTDPNAPPTASNLVVNGGFEAFTGDLVDNAYKLFKNGEVGPWQSSTNQIELWDSGHNGVSAPVGRIFTEIDAQNGILSQQIKTEAGKSYDLSFDFSGRPNYVVSSKMEVLWNGQVIAAITPNDATFKAYSFKVTGTGGNDALAFRSIADDNDSVGGLLDKVMLTLPPSATGNLIADGGFEASPAGFGKVGVAWTLTGAGGVDTTASRTAEGSKYFAFDGWANSHDAVLSQGINTVVGQIYTLKFKAAVYGLTTADAQIKMEALNGTTLVDSETVAIKNGMTEYSMTFTATSAHTAIRLSDVSPKGQSNFDIDVDAVSLTASTTPPPATVNLIINGGFEAFTGDLGDNAYKLFKNGKVGPWQSSTNQIELWDSGHNGMSAPAGRAFTEVDAYNGVLSQSVNTETGKYYGISFDYAGRPSFIASSKMEVLWNGAVIGTVMPANSTMTGYHFHATGTGGNDVLAFRSVAGDNDSVGGLLDKVELIVSSHLPADSFNMIQATTADGYMTGTDGTDHLMGADHLVGNAGNDIYVMI
ncbi:uncharacterized protein DUF642 [Nitrosomonas sp. Nm84]|uniref:DUF642 domain-containing protein n=1 Tax=Nitrosomonas sp. Nm84 TaxID=200124 RepID=UPI000D771B7D|nr:DUF642 domain-containing protein [Nitrosomonas sp. Nm84]PXW89886.1 uncharacterized protein DUF642 [Nitrosomonas sp. Nm84]